MMIRRMVMIMLMVMITGILSVCKGYFGLILGLMLKPGFLLVIIT
jgi:hypothetical protein